MIAVCLDLCRHVMACAVKERKQTSHGTGCDKSYSLLETTIRLAVGRTVVLRYVQQQQINLYRQTTGAHRHIYVHTHAHTTNHRLPNNAAVSKHVCRPLSKQAKVPEIKIVTNGNAAGIADDDAGGGFVSRSSNNVSSFKWVVVDVRHDRHDTTHDSQSVYRSQQWVSESLTRQW